MKNEKIVYTLGTGRKWFCGFSRQRARDALVGEGKLGEMIKKEKGRWKEKW